MGIEIMIIIIFLVDNILEITHKHYDYDRDYKKKFIYNFKFASNLIINLVMLGDITHFYTYYPITALRFTRILRPSYFYITLSRIIFSEVNSLF